MAWWTVIAVVASVLTAGQSYIQAKKAQKLARKNQAKNQELLINKESNVEPIPVIYGERRVGGTRVFIHTGRTTTAGGTTYYEPTTGQFVTVGDTSAPNEYLYVAIVLAEGEVESITDIEIDDLPIGDAKYLGLIAYAVHKGADTQTAVTYLDKSTTQWTVNHTLSGVAYIELRFKYAPEIWSGVPQITAVVKGQKVYDPRKDSTSSAYDSDLGTSTHRADDSTTWEWSNNPALCIRDYLTNNRYGKGVPGYDDSLNGIVSAIDDDAFGDAATDCEESVTIHENTEDTMQLFECNVVLDTDKTLFDNVNILLMGCRGFLPYVQGKYALRIDGVRSSLFTFTKEHIIGGIRISGESKEDKFNRVIAKFSNPDRKWQDDTAVWPPANSQDESDYLNEDGGVLLQDDIEMDTITNYYQARDLARVFLLRSRNQLKANIKTTSEGLAYTVGDVISITHDTPGWTAKPFIIEQVQMNDDMTAEFSLVEYQSNIYTYDVNAEQEEIPDTSLHDPTVVNPPTSLSVTEDSDVNTDGSVRYRAYVSWTASTDLFVTSYHVQGKLSTATNYVESKTTETYYEIEGLKPGTYDVRVRSVSDSFNAYSAWVSTTVVIGGKTSANAAPTNVTATGKLKQILVDWDDPTDADHKESQVYRNTSNDSGTASKIATTNASYFIDTTVTPGTTYYYWVKSVDRSANVSGFSSVASASADNEATGSPQYQIGYVYYQTSTSSDPGNPTATSYTFSDGSFAGLTSGWGVNPPTVGGSSQIWYSRFTVTESSAGSGTGTPSFEDSEQGYGFVGLVTFSSSTTLTDGTNSFNSATKIDNGGAASDVNNNVTTINGGKITANTLSINSLTTNSYSYQSGLLFGLGTTLHQVNGYYATGFFFSSNFSYVGGVFGVNAGQAVALAAGNASGTSGDVAIIGYGNTTSTYGSPVTNGILGEPNYGARGYHNSSGYYAELGTSSHGIYARGDCELIGGGTYTPFTGSHQALLSSSETIEIGDIVVDVAIVAKVGVSDTISVISKSTAQNQAQAVGVFAKYANTDIIPVALQTITTPSADEKIPTPIISTKEEYLTLLEANDVIYMNSVGEGQVNVCGENGDIQAGDLIVTSSVPGKGMKQNDDIIRSCTVAKARESVTFSGSETAQIACIYLCG